MHSSYKINPLDYFAIEKYIGNTDNGLLRNNRYEKDQKLCGPLYETFDIREYPTRESIHRITVNNVDHYIWKYWIFERHW